MKINTILLIVTTFIAIVFSIEMSFSDPSVPPPPPPVTSYTYILMDQFRSCGPQDNTAEFCDEYYTRQKVVASSTSTTVTETNVCGKDSRCDVGVACEINNPVDNSSWRNITLGDNWKCPSGYGITQKHEPGTLNPNYDTISIASPSIIGEATHGYSLQDEISSDLYFNSYIPACVNRIPMMNFEVYLEDSMGNQTSNKVGLYALHETLDYDANPTGGVLKNFNFSKQDSFRKSHSLVGDLRTYRMWSFRERFSEGLIRTVDQENLEIPGNINVDALSGITDHDYEEIYFSRDFMSGSFNVSNLGGQPIGTNITTRTSINCNLDVSD